MTSDLGGMTAAEKRPYRILRAIVVAMPLAILVGAVLTPDPFAQVLAMALAFVVVFSIVRRITTERRLRTRDLALFFVFVLASVSVGLWALPRATGRPSSEIGRVFVTGLGIVVSAAAVAAVNRGKD
ncbi:MAG: hypothetical protein ACOCSF_08245 [Halanaeroarchaeum sp.]